MDAKELRRVVADSTLSGAQIARDAGLSVHTMNAYTAGNRRPTPAALHKLAAGLDARADRLRELAETLRTEAG